MGIFGDSGFLGKLFDLNGDGKVDLAEQTLEFMVLDEALNGDEDGEKDVFDNDLYDDFSADNGDY